MKEILIINLTRMGDLLQTTPVMAGLKDECPGARITLVVNSQFAEICRGIPFIDELIVFEMKDLKIRLAGPRQSIAEGFRYLKRVINEINKKEYELAINFTHSSVSALLMSLVRAGEVRGYTVDSEGHKLIRHPWMRYFFNVVPNREYNPFHLVDMNLKSVGVTSQSQKLLYEIPEDAVAKVDDLLREEGVLENDMLVGIHLGASKGDKRWPSPSFALLADMIVREFGAKIILFGSPDEVGLSREFETAAGFEPLNFAGRTNLGELAALLRRCSLLISNDTGPLHLATAVGTTVIDIFTANVHYLETGPYGKGHYVVQSDLPCVPCDFHVECNNMICKDVIRAEAVFEAVLMATGRKPEKEATAAVWKDAQVYRTYFREDGLLGFLPLIQRHLKKDTVYRDLYREVWDRRPVISGKTDMVFENMCTELSSSYLLDGIDDIVLSLRREAGELEQIVNLAGEGFDLVSLIAGEASGEQPDFGHIREIWKNVESVDAGIETIGYANPCLRPLVLLFTYSKESLEGDGLLAQTEAACGIYGDLHTAAEYMLGLIKKLVPFFESVSEGKMLREGAAHIS
ncbi:MAG: glycosyltransferase family 9 protein [Nitrospiraceae bacterium]|nr:MAG: glycosyltransferase family 9 protein [Nitrospiraceae bacterium]